MESVGIKIEAEEEVTGDDGEDVVTSIAGFISVTEPDLSNGILVVRPL